MTLDVVFDADLCIEDSGEETRYGELAHRAWNAALAHCASPADSIGCVRFCGRGVSQEFNARYRGKDKPTNVLSFSGELDQPGIVFLGDLLICLPLVADEAEAQGKTLENHLQHLVVHGVLHLLGHDHEAEGEADVMESLEVEVLASLGVSNPY